MKLKQYNNADDIAYGALVNVSYLLSSAALILLMPLFLVLLVLLLLVLLLMSRLLLLVLFVLAASITITRVTARTQPSTPSAGSRKRSNPEFNVRAVVMSRKCDCEGEGNTSTFYFHSSNHLRCHYIYGLCNLC